MTSSYLPLTSFNALVGIFGGGGRSDYTAIGSSVNLAARLQKVADANHILVSEKVANYLDAHEITEVKSFQLKGIAQEILAFLVKM